MAHAASDNVNEKSYILEEIREARKNLEDVSKPSPSRSAKRWRMWSTAYVSVPRNRRRRIGSLDRERTSRICLSCFLFRFTEICSTRRKRSKNYNKIFIILGHYITKRTVFLNSKNVSQEGLVIIVDALMYNLKHPRSLLKWEGRLIRAWLLLQTEYFVVKIKRQCWYRYNHFFIIYVKRDWL